MAPHTRIVPPHDLNQAMGKMIMNHTVCKQIKTCCRDAKTTPSVLIFLLVLGGFGNEYLPPASVDGFFKNMLFIDALDHMIGVKIPTDAWSAIRDIIRDHFKPMSAIPLLHAVCRSLRHAADAVTKHVLADIMVDICALLTEQERNSHECFRLMAPFGGLCVEAPPPPVQVIDIARVYGLDDEKPFENGDFRLLKDKKKRYNKVKYDPDNEIEEIEEID
jgi:hypothetical protein